MQAARPRMLLAPLQVGLGVQMHHQFASQFLIDVLFQLGFCVSYTEVKKFEMSAAMTQGTDIPGITQEHFVQYVADNVDHNVCTLDGLGTFHGMGTIAAVTPGTQGKHPIRRIFATLEDVAAVGKIDIHYYNHTGQDLECLRYTQLHDFSCEDPQSTQDLLWKLSWPLRSPRPAWSGFMQLVNRGEHPGRSSVFFLPMIDLNPNDMSCIYSTLRFVCVEARRHRIKPVLTFDQPLWWKSQMIVQKEPEDSDLKSVILRLGGFHIQMSFLGCIGRIMSGSGLQQVLEVVYAPNTVGHMLAGKAMARAFRGHMLVDAALNAMITAKAFDVCLPVSQAVISDENLSEEDNEAQTDSQLYEIDESQTAQGEFDEVPEDLRLALEEFDILLQGEAPSVPKEVLDRLQQQVEKEKLKMDGHRTARLWLQYMEMVDILRRSMRAERTGNWHLHLRALREMLPFLAAAGHNSYTKSIYIYLLQMQDLPFSHPEVYESFCNGHHVIRRSERYWAGLSPDLVIEQVLMRSVKTTGGLTRGRGIGESQRTQWLLSTPACAEINSAIQEVTGTQYCSSEQHKEAADSRQLRDDKDTVAVFQYLSSRDPFGSESPSLFNIANGMTSGKDVNADEAKEVGHQILQTMLGKAVSEHTFKRKDQVVTMTVKNSLTIGGESISVDPQLLFQRLVTAARDLTEDTRDLFRYELCGHPSSLFEPSGLMRPAVKAALADALWTMAGCTDIPFPKLDENTLFVLDGGSLLHRLPWPRGATFGGLCTSYVNFVQRHYMRSITVFDGYGSDPSTKDMAHLRRSGGVGTTVNFNADMVLSSKKEEFLANHVNKQKFISMLSNMLLANGHSTLHSPNDADLLIVATAVKCAADNPVVVIGEDTDLLILLCHHVSPNLKTIIFRSDSKSKSKKHREWDIQWLQQALGKDICQALLFVHAITGCDTTSRLFGVGKGTPTLRKLKTENIFHAAAEVFSKRTATLEEVVSAGEQVIISMYKGNRNDTLDELRYKRFTEKVALSTTFVQVHSLPPTSNASKYHSMRTYLQVQQWTHSDCNLNPEEWGWCVNDNRLEPRTTDLPPAPDALLQVIRCNCRTDCDSRRCSCKKHGLACSIACGICRGVTCANSPVISMEEVTEEY